MTDLPVVALSGPTASGKSALAVEAAQRLAGVGIAVEVVNADSMLVYRGMDIGTAKPSVAERGEVPHHLIDIMDVTDSATVAEFQRLARAALDNCRARGVIPLVVGGSALYLRAVLDEFDFPGTDPAVRSRLETELAERGPVALHQRLSALSPQAASGILPGNARRIVRALEVIELTGDFRSTLPRWTYAVGDVVQFGVRLPRAEMDARIEVRVAQMWADGFVDEVRSLERQGLRQGRTASRALGYRQILRFLDGELSEEQARADTVSGTRRFARKQLGWFRRDDRISWLETGDLAAADRVVAAVRDRVEGPA